ncbi:ABC transporter permease [Marinovum sp. 2_MG-2023]|uniref:ABC transporter permease n=1 Tax=unclassified Marinovum TaxID=2647166 RepID=UPI0026E23067|nr:MULTISPECIES: ABC transporter permease [unclassified Marinovum]MDO6730936.1 ABC transporter permease [Marinovum sp. 2_MG-2023]MDO6780163.1 ABC transporter permease [Marinovum sp. 1_MG-2023]
MMRLLLNRLFRGVLTIWGVLTFVFIMLRLSGDPLDALLGDEATPEMIAYYTRLYGFDQPIWQQYANYFTGLWQGNWGISYRDGRDAFAVVMERIPATLYLGLSAFVFSLILGVPLGILAARHRNSAIDRFAMGLAVLGFALPNFFLGILMLLLFTMTWQILPSSGAGSLAHYIMPVITLGTSGAGSIARFTRSAMLEVMNRPYMRTARAKGLLPGARLRRHALPNAAIPVVTILGFRLGDMIAGSVVVETVFAWPGVGRLLVNSVTARELAIVQAIVVLVTCTMVIANLMVDLLYGWLDPRQRDAKADDNG